MKKRIFILIIIVLAGSIFISKPVLAAWTQAKGHSYNQLTLSYYTSDQKYSSIENSAGVIETIDQPEYSDYKLSYYGEYGITDTLTVFTSIPYAWVKSQDVNTASPGEDGPSGVGDIDLGLRYKLVNNLIGTGALMSFQTQVKIPEAYQVKYDFANPLEFQNLGDGQYDWTLALLFGKGFNKGYSVLSAGYKFRFENDEVCGSCSFRPSDQIKVRMDAGYALHPKLSLRGNLEWTKSVGNASISQGMIRKNYKTGGRYDDEEKIIKDSLSLEPDNLTLGLALAYSVAPKIQVVLSYNTVVGGIGGGDFLRSKDTGKGDTYAIALAYTY